MKHVEVRSEGAWSGVYAVRRFRRGDRVLDVSGEKHPAPTRYSIQVAEHSHVYPPDGSPWKYLNHRCRPNLTFDVETSGFISRGPISAGNELSFNYVTTEWEMAEGFECRCGSPWCYGYIAGFKHLPRAIQEVLLTITAPHIRTLFEASHRRQTG